MPKSRPLLIKWSERASSRIQAKVDDALAHAQKALTESLRRTPDGRPTLRRARRSPSLAAAKARLDELLDLLAGPSVASREGLLRDAREAFYRESFDRWKPLVPADLKVSPDPMPTSPDLTAARTLALHGRDLRDELAPLIDGAKRRLSAAVVLGSSRDEGGDGVDLGRAWARSAKNTLTTAANLALGDSLVALDRIAGRDLIDPKHLDLTALEN